MKNKRRALGLILLLLLACGTRRTEKQQATQQTFSEHLNRTEQSEQQRWQRNLIIKDTTLQEYQIEITPLGKFTYSTEKGFEGEASSMHWSKKSVAQRTASLNEDLSKFKAKHKNELNKTESDLKISTKAKEQHGSYWKYLWLTISLLTVGYICWRFKGYLKLCFGNKSP